MESGENPCLVQRLGQGEQDPVLLNIGSSHWVESCLLASQTQLVHVELKTGLRNA